MKADSRTTTSRVARCRSGLHEIHPRLSLDDRSRCPCVGDNREASRGWRLMYDSRYLTRPCQGPPLYHLDAGPTGPVYTFVISIRLYQSIRIRFQIPIRPADRQDDPPGCSLPLEPRISSSHPGRKQAESQNPGGVSP